ncbi:MAG: hypothetical protein KKH32_11495 [Bacteroidetes bacterium]|nr:hypothetical protein [Bacteroidota bacterium]
MYRNILYSIIILTTLSTNGLAQKNFNISAGMGLNYYLMESLNDYLSYNWGFNNRQDDFNGAVDFFGSFGFDLSSDYSIDLDVSYSINSFNTSVGTGSYEFAYSLIMPSLILNYHFGQNGYRISFGAGGGYHFADVSEKIPGSISTSEFSAKGFGFMIKADGISAISSNLFILINVNARYNSFSDVLNGSQSLIINKPSKEKLNLSFTSMGLRLGMKYIF